VRLGATNLPARVLPIHPAINVPVKTLVTGGAGFIGSHVVARLLAAGDDVVVLDSLEAQVHDGVPPAVPREVQFIHGSVGDSALACHALDGVDRVVHLAAAVGVGQSMYEMSRYVDVNTLATARFLEQLVERSEPLTRVVVASSMSIYGEGAYLCPSHGHLAPPPRPEEQLVARQWEVRCEHCGEPLQPIATGERKPLLPTSIYAITKRDQEEMCLVAGGAYGIPTVALRFFNAYGPGQALSNPYTGAAAIFSSRLLNDRPPLIFEDGEQSRDFIHVSDVARAVVLALDSERAVGRSINVGTGRSVTIAEVAQILADGLGKEIAPTRPGKYRAGDIRHCYADTMLAEELLDFRASVRLEDGIEELIGWVRTQTADDRVDAAATELISRGLAR
jgi:dTDP-L-rhamnose 4-epimerase